MIFVGDDWAETHHDVYLMDEGGKRLVSRRLPEGDAAGCLGVTLSDECLAVLHARTEGWAAFR